MTDEEIIKCFNICLKCDNACEGCGFKGEVCDGSLKGKIKTLKMVSDLINRQQAENERLSSSAKQWKETAKDLLISKEKQQAEIENLNNFLYDAEGVNLVNYWYQQCEIAENGCRNLEEENKKLKAEIERLQKNSKKVLETCSRVTKANDELNNEIFQGAIEVVRAEAIKEFAERLKRLKQMPLITTVDIDNLVKEMVGEDK